MLKMHETKEVNIMYRNRIIYQIYPLSFKDSNNDGIGDIKGIISILIEKNYIKKVKFGLLLLGFLPMSYLCLQEIKYLQISAFLRLLHSRF